MFSKIEKTNFPPTIKPVLVWDGKCGFCNYWVTRWKNKTGDRILFKTFQEVSVDFADIPLKEFKKASRLIDLDGKVYSGPDSAYKSLTFSEEKGFSYHDWYINNSFFTWISDHGYNFIAKHRSFFFKITKTLCGSNPLNPRPYWVFYLFIFLVSILLLLFL